MIAFFIWLLIGIAFISYGVYAFFSKKAVPVKNVRAYNRAVGRLWCVFGVVLALLGIPLLQGQNTPGVIVSVLGTMIAAIAAMAVYVLVIERKYRNK